MKAASFGAPEGKNDRTKTKKELERVGSITLSVAKGRRMDTRILLVIAGAVLLHGWVSRRLDRLWITPPLAFIAIGIIFGPSGFVLCQLSADAPLIDFIAEITLILILFSDASRISLRRLRREVSTPLRMLGIRLP